MIHDLRYAIRALRGSPGFAVVALISLSLGIGANTAVFTLINTLLLRSLPVKQPEKLVALYRSTPSASRLGIFDYVLFRELRDRSDLFAGVLCQKGILGTVSINGNAERVTGELVSGNYFDVLGITPAAGRLIQKQDELNADLNRVVVLSYAFWERQFGGDPRIIGKTLEINTVSMTIIGVSPPEFKSLTVGLSPDVRIPITAWPQISGDGTKLQAPTSWWLNIVARLRPDVSKKAAESAANAIFNNYVTENNKSSKSVLAKRTWRERVSLVETSTGIRVQSRDHSKQLYVLMAIVSLVLLAACVNLANLLLAKTVARRGELATRIALGAQRSQVGRQLLIESVLLAGGGAIIGTFLAIIGARSMIVFLVTSDSSNSITLMPDWHVLLFTVTVSLATGLLFGLAPALKSIKFDLSHELKCEQTRMPGVRGLGWRVLMIAQIAISFLLLVGASVFSRSLSNLKGVNVGFDQRNILELSMDPTVSGMNQDQARQFYREVLESVTKLPDVISASYARVGLIDSLYWRSGMTIEGREVKDNDPGPDWNIVGPGYFRLLRSNLMQGRDFQSTDTRSSKHVAIINQSFAHFYFGDDSPMGRHIGPGNKQDPGDYEVIGIVGDSKYGSLRENSQRFWYIPYEQHSSVQDLTLYVRTRENAKAQAGEIRKVVRSVAPLVAVFDVGTVEEKIDEHLATDQMIALSTACFGILATLVASIGIYGVMNYAVLKRTQEIGLRMALGAERSAVLWMIMREVVLVLTLGVALGLPCVWILGRMVEFMLFKVSPTDALLVITSAILLLIITSIAGFIPARRAIQIDPMVALRYD